MLGGHKEGEEEGDDETEGENRKDSWIIYDDGDGIVGMSILPRLPCQPV